MEKYRFRFRFLLINLYETIWARKPWEKPASCGWHWIMDFKIFIVYSCGRVKANSATCVERMIRILSEPYSRPTVAYVL